MAGAQGLFNGSRKRLHANLGQFLEAHVDRLRPAVLWDFRSNFLENAQATVFADFLETHAPLPLRVLDVSNNYIDADRNSQVPVRARVWRGIVKLSGSQMSSMIAREWVRMLGWSLFRDSRKAETIVDENLRYWFNETYAVGGVSDVGSIDAVIDCVFGREVVPVRQTLIDALTVDLSSSQNVLRSIVDMVCRRGPSRVPSLFAVEAGFRYVSGATVQAGNNDYDSAMKAAKKKNAEDWFSATKAAKKKNAEDWFSATKAAKKKNADDWFSATKAAKKNAEDWFDAASAVDTVFLRQLRPELRSWLTDESENVSDASGTVSSKTGSPQPSTVLMPAEHRASTSGGLNPADGAAAWKGSADGAAWKGSADGVGSKGSFWKTDLLSWLFKSDRRRPHGDQFPRHCPNPV